MVSPNLIQRVSLLSCVFACVGVGVGCGGSPSQKVPANIVVASSALNWYHGCGDEIVAELTLELTADLQPIEEKDIEILKADWSGWYSTSEMRLAFQEDQKFPIAVNDTAWVRFVGRSDGSLMSCGDFDHESQGETTVSISLSYAGDVFETTAYAGVGCGYNEAPLDGC